MFRYFNDLISLFFSFLILRQPSSSTLFPYTTLFRSQRTRTAGVVAFDQRRDQDIARRDRHTEDHRPGQEPDLVGHQSEPEPGDHHHERDEHGARQPEPPPEADDGRGQQREAQDGDRDQQARRAAADPFVTLYLVQHGGHGGDRQPEVDRDQEHA